MRAFQYLSNESFGKFHFTDNFLTFLYFIMIQLKNNCCNSRMQTRNSKY